jgi:hypothetical protein
MRVIHYTPQGGIFWRVLRFGLLHLALLWCCSQRLIRADVLPPSPDLFDVCILPTQAFLCDIVGTGRVIGSSPHTFRIEVDNYWLGNPGSNSLDIAANDLIPPVTNSPIVFFATTNSYFKHDIAEPLSLLCQWSFLTNRVIDPAQTEQGETVVVFPAPLHLIGDGLSWFPAEKEVDGITEFASNLVHRARIQADYSAFYNIVRDGTRVSAEVSPRIFRDSFLQLLYWGIYDSGTYRQVILDDTQISDRAKGILRMFLK